MFSKPENVLQRSDKWLLVDFGSCMRGVRRPASEDERNTLTDELNAQTTLIYRAPEMLDLFRNQPIGPPSDVWALGCTVGRRRGGLLALLTRERRRTMHCI